MEFRVTYKDILLSRVSFGNGWRWLLALAHPLELICHSLSPLELLEKKGQFILYIIDSLYEWKLKVGGSLEQCCSNPGGLDAPLNDLSSMLSLSSACMTTAHNITVLYRTATFMYDCRAGFAGTAGSVLAGPVCSPLNSIK